MDESEFSRLAQPPGWVREGELYERIRKLWPLATVEERALLATASQRHWFSECTDAEQDVIRSLTARASPD